MEERERTTARRARDDERERRIIGKDYGRGELLAFGKPQIWEKGESSSTRQPLSLLLCFAHNR